MAEHIKDVLEGFLKSKKDKVDFYGRLAVCVDKALDKKLRGKITIKEVAGNTLVLVAQDAAARYEGKLKGKEFLEKVGREFPTIKKVEIKAG